FQSAMGCHQNGRSGCFINFSGLTTGQSVLNHFVATNAMLPRYLIQPHHHLMGFQFFSIDSRGKAAVEPDSAFHGLIRSLRGISGIFVATFRQRIPRADIRIRTDGCPPPDALSNEREVTILVQFDDGTEERIAFPLLSPSSREAEDALNEDADDGAASP
ncbi:MAG: hypothetical protein R6U20_10055, partial [Longimonas sp.]